MNFTQPTCCYFLMLSARLSACPSAHLPACPPARLFACLPARLSDCQSVRRSICLYDYLSVCLTNRLSVKLFHYLPVNPRLYVFIIFLYVSFLFTHSFNHYRHLVILSYIIIFDILTVYYTFL